MQVAIPTIDEIRAAVREEVREELAAFSTSPKFQTEQADEIGDVEFASRITGKAVPTIYALVSTRKIPHAKKGKKLYFSKKELLAWIQGGRRKTTEEIQQEAKTR